MAGCVRCGHRQFAVRRFWVRLPHWKKAKFFEDRFCGICCTALAQLEGWYEWCEFAGFGYTCDDGGVGFLCTVWEHQGDFHLLVPRLFCTAGPFLEQVGRVDNESR